MADRSDLDALKARLADNADAIARHLFGKPTSQTRYELRFGKDFSSKRGNGIAVHIAGPRRGLFANHYQNKYGSLIDAFGYAYGLNFKDACDAARRWLGEDVDGPPPTYRIFQLRPAAPVIDVDQDTEQKKKRAQALYEAAVPLVDGPGAQYLTGRGIEAWPDCVRWHGDGFLIFPATSPKASEGKGAVTAIQRIYLNADGSARLDEDGGKIKRSLGPRYKGAVRFPGNRTGVLLLAEGPETALSVWYAISFDTWATLGSVAHVDLTGVPVETTIIVCRDDDKRDAPTAQAIRKQIKKWRREGRTVLDVLPFDLSRRDKSDFNDALTEKGSDYIRQRIEGLIAPVDETPLQDLMTATRSLASATSEAVQRLWSGDASALGLKVSLGLGKTRQALIEAVDWIAAGRGTVVIAVPTNQLSREQVERAVKIAREKGITLRIGRWRGREYEDPDEGPMCFDVPGVRAVQKAGGDPQKLVCKSGENECPHFRSCPYQAQRKQKADLWLVPHASLFTQKPETIEKPTLLIIDECFSQAGIGGTSGRPEHITPDTLDLLPWAGNPSKSADIEAGLMPVRRILADALHGLTGHDRIPVSREMLLAAGLTKDMCIEAGKLEWQRKIDPDVRPGMTAAERNRALKTTESNHDIFRLARMWAELANILDDDGPAVSGRLTWELVKDKEAGTTYRALRQVWRRDFHEGWQAPTLHIDATMRPNIIRHHLPGFEVHAEIKAAAPHQRVIQYVGKSFSKGALYDDSLTDALRTFVTCQAIAHGGEWLLVTSMHAAERIREGLPDFVTAAHFNSVRGRYEWKDVRGEVIAGRTAASPLQVEQMAGALTGKHVDPVDG